jgi:hypothetical protein
VRLQPLLFVAVGCGRIGFSPVEREDASVDPALVAWYPFDAAASGGGFEDATGNGHFATCAAGCPPIVAGRVGGAAMFGPHELKVVDDGSLSFPGGFTIAAFVWVDDFSTIPAPVSKVLGEEQANSYQFEYDPTGVPAFTTADATFDSIDYAPTAVDPGSWHHLAGTWVGGEKRLFVDGVVVDSRTRPVDFDAGNLYLGGDRNDGTATSPLYGKLDDVRVYRRALDDAEIAGLAAQ